jgi:peroxiredoxin
MTYTPTPQLVLSTSKWFNTPQSFTLSELRGKVVVLFAFQMLCPGCVTRSIPQAIKMHEILSKSEVAVVGIHTVFEHHSVMTEDALEVFIHEYRILFPVAADKPSLESDIPQTMQALNLQGTPSIIVLDRQGHIRLNHFGHVDDLLIGSVIGSLLAEPVTQ